ncbi:MAG: dockerin type I repeat-containing protein, partial [Oscillospiraceae bacterium]|nr:dockerin type I repeat-containing protein [Oscillospiraceae bacterium]
MLTPANITNLSVFAENPDADNLPADFWYYKGDLNQDISVGVADVILMQKYLLGLEQITEEQFRIGDLDSDGIINIYDFVLLKQVVLNGAWTMIRHELPQDEPDKPDISENFIPAPIAEIDASLPSQGNANLVIFYVDFPDCPYT